MAMTTLFGYFSLSMKDIFNGKTPRETDDPKTWLYAALAGGGLGLWGDVIDPRSRGFGRDVFDAFRGPVADVLVESPTRITFSMVDGTYYYLSGDIDKWEREMNKARKESLRLATRVTPLKNLWVTNLLLERTLLDALRRMSDNNYDSNLKRQRTRLEKEGQQFYWAPGESEPDLELLQESIMGDE